MLKKLLKSYPDKVAGQEAVSEKKAALIYGALEAHPETYKIVPDKSVRSRMNVCFRVTKVSYFHIIKEAPSHELLLPTTP